jgi:hypothetical protein
MKASTCLRSATLPNSRARLRRIVRAGDEREPAGVVRRAPREHVAAVEAKQGVDAAVVQEAEPADLIDRASRSPAGTRPAGWRSGRSRTRPRRAGRA